MPKVDIAYIEQKFAEFEKKVKRLKEIEAELETLDARTLELDAEEIRKDIKNPGKLNLVEKKLSDLKKKIELRDTEVPKLSDFGRSLAKKALDAYNTGKYDEALKLFYESLEKLNKAYNGAVDIRDNYREGILTTALQEVHLGVVHTKRALAKRIADEALNLFNKKSYEDAKRKYEQSKSDLENARSEYMQPAEVKIDKNTSEEIIQRIDEEIKIAEKNIENSEIGMDSQRVKDLYKKAEEKFIEAREKEDEDFYENAIDILMETEKYFNDAFIIAKKREFSDDLLELDNLLRKVDREKRELRQKLATGIGDRIGFTDGIEEVTINIGKILETSEEDFQIIKELGKGAFGTVYLVKNRKLDRQRALKILSENYCKDASLVERFLKEAQIAAKLEDHPNIIQIYNVGTFLKTRGEKIPFIEMRYIEGSRDLKKILVEKKRLEYPFVIAIALQICDALDFSHRKEVLHKDIKPSNILLYYKAETKTRLTFSDGATVTPNIIITDFGIAGAKEEERRRMTAFTPEYASPEQISGQRLDERTDIYSLGRMLYEMLTGELPLKEDPLPLQKTVKEVPGYLNNIVLRCLESERENRFRSAEELMNALQEKVDFDPFDYGITQFKK